jgi:O-antigen/teichoic acid export membrane protein
MFILSLTLPIVALNVPFWLTLNANGLEKQVSNIAILTAMISLIVNAVLSKMFFALGTAFSVLFTETFFTIGVILLSIQHKIFKHNEQNS